MANSATSPSSDSKTYFTTTVDGQQRKLLSVRESRKNDGLTLVLYSGELAFQRDLVEKPVIEQRYSVHDSPHSPGENTIKHSQRFLDGKSLETFIQTDAFYNRFDRSEILYARTCPELGLDRYLYRKRDRDREVSTGSHDQYMQTLLYSVAVSRSGAPAFAPSTKFYVTKADFGLFSVHMAYCFSNMPAFKGYTGHAMSSDPVINKKIVGTGLRSVSGGFSRREATRSVIQAFQALHAHKIAEAHESNLFELEDLYLFEEVGPGVMTYEQSRERFRQLARWNKRRKPRDYHPRKMQLSPEL